MKIDAWTEKLHDYPMLADLPQRLQQTPRAPERRKLIAVRGVQGMNADGCTYYRLQGSELSFEIVLSRSLELGGSEYGARSVDFPSIPVRGYDGVAEDDCLAVRAAVEKRTVHVADVSRELGDDAFRTHGFDRLMDYHTDSILSVPVLDDGEVVGVLQFINAKNSEQQSVPFDARRVALAEILAELMADAQD